MGNPTLYYIFENLKMQEAQKHFLSFVLIDIQGE